MSQSVRSSLGHAIVGRSNDRKEGTGVYPRAVARLISMAMCFKHGNLVFSVFVFAYLYRNGQLARIGFA
jgi:hypothetical protein